MGVLPSESIEIKYLGIILDPQLTFSAHIDYLCKKLGKKIGFLCRVSHCLSQWAKTLVYNTIIRPHFDYCSSLLISCTKENMHRLQIQQNKAMRLILGCNRYTPIDAILRTLDWLSVKQGIERANLILIYKIERGQLPSYLSDFLEKRSTFFEYNIRSRENYNIQFVKSASLQKSLFCDGVRLYNALPGELKSATSVSTFSKNVSKYLKSV